MSETSNDKRLQDCCSSNTIKLSIIIVSWNTREALLGCLNAIFRTIKDIDFEVFVVDNASTDNSQEAVRNFFPSVKLIENRENVGFAKANNQALQLMKGKYALLLNSDTITSDGAITKIMEFMELNQSIGICGAQLLNKDGTKQRSFDNISTPLTDLINNTVLRIIFPKKYLGKNCKFDKPVEVESVVGACMLVRKKAINEVGLMDENFFFYYEDMDWCCRMRERGWSVYFHPDAFIYHIRGESSKQLNEKAIIEFWKSKYYFFKKHYGKKTTVHLEIGFLLKIVVGIILNIPLAIFKSRNIKKLRKYIVVLLWHLKGKP